jgi:phenylacetate-CoA ligase
MNNKSKMEKLLRYVLEHNPHYRELQSLISIDKAEITKFPTISKPLISLQNRNLISDSFLADYFAGKLVVTSSSGTTGIPTKVYWNADGYNLSVIELWRRRIQYYGVFPAYKRVDFSLTHTHGEAISEFVYSMNDLNRTLSFSRTTLNNKEHLEMFRVLLEDYQPDWVYIQPAILKRIIDYYNDTKTTPPASIKYIECVGELLPNALKVAAIQLFSAIVVNFYGSEEMGPIAYECPEHNMHILSDNVYVECGLDSGISDHGYGFAIITNLNNYAMPLIRYEQGDMIEKRNLDSNCKCGSHEPVITFIRGRIRESTVRKGQIIDTFLVAEVIDEINNLYSNVVKQFRFKYIKSQDLLIAYIKYNGSLRNAKLFIRDKIKEALSLRGISDITINLELMSDDSFAEIYNDKKYTIFSIE